MAVLRSTSLTGCNSIPDFIAAESLMFFQSSTAPTGWTKQTTHNDKALRVVTGNAVPGGTNSFSAVFASRSIPGTVGDTTLSTPQIPSHSHTMILLNQPLMGQGGGFIHPWGKGPTATGAAGGGESHSHPFTGDSLSFQVLYVDLIICSKN